MFIELSEFLHCPEAHQESFCVVAPDMMAGRMIVRGIVGCPTCQREYRIEDGIVRFGEAGRSGQRWAEGAELPEPDVIHALLGLTNPGGFVVLVGSAARLAGALGERMGGVHFVGVNPPGDVAMTPALSLLVHPEKIPLRHSMARGVVLGPDHASEPWIGEGTRVLLEGLRLVAVTDSVSAPGLQRLVAGPGLWVGQKLGKREAGRGKGGIGP